MAKRDIIWLPLIEAHRTQIINLVMFARRLAEETAKMESFAKELIKISVWRWTADAINPKTNRVVWDAIKYDIRYLSHTENAAAIWHSSPDSELGNFLRHEHSIPIKVVTSEVLALSASDWKSIRDVFHEICHSAIVTRSEDKMISNRKLRESMPIGWSRGMDICSRYSSVGLKLLFPTGVK